MITEREHWLKVTRSRNWKREHIFDPNICPAATINAITSAFPDDPQHILEIGCGFGRLACLVAQQYPWARVFGIDVNPHILEHGLEGVTYLCCDGIPDALSQDAIYSVAVFQHLPDTEKVSYIQQAFDALNPGGVFRVQFIEGDRDDFLEHWTPRVEIVKWFMHAGFRVGELDQGLAHPQWTWITGVK